MNFDEWFYKEFESKGKLTNDLGIKELMRFSWDAAIAETIKKMLDLFEKDLDRINK